MSMNIKDILGKLSSFKKAKDAKDIDIAELGITVDSAIRLIVALYNESQTMGDVLHSIATAMRLLNKGATQND